MGKIGKTLALLLIAICLTSIAILSSFVEAQTSNNSAPVIEWQYEYGNNTESISNVIQTSDGGYAFMNLGWMHGFTLYPATLYKVDSVGKIQWEKTLDYFIGQSIVQTSDFGYELTGEWSTYGTTYEETPTILKTDSGGNIQWYENYTSIPSFNVGYSQIQTSDGGYASMQSGSLISAATLIKVDSNNQTQWTKELRGFRQGFGIYGIVPFSLIETSDGAIVVLGVDNPAFGENVFGRIYLTKTEPFLPTPSPSELPTPIPAPTTQIVKTLNSWYILIIALTIAVVIVIGLLLCRKASKNR